MTDLLEVGDTVIVENAFVKSKYKITRVTKTLALSRLNSEGSERRFYRDTKKKGVAYPKRKFDKNTYSIIKDSK